MYQDERWCCKTDFGIRALFQLQAGSRISTNRNREKQWGKTWYVDPESGEKKVPGTAHLNLSVK
jgi:hypothetical protein